MSPTTEAEAALAASPKAPEGKAVATPVKETFALGRSLRVDVGNVERELAALWTRAGGARSGEGGEHGDTQTPVMRAALWTLVLGAHGPASLKHAKGLVDALVTALPARVIVLCQSGDDGVPDGHAEEIQATIETNVLGGAGHARTLYSEEITLTGYGRGEEHFPALVRSLQIPNLPTAIFWIDPQMDDAILEQLLPVGDRLVVDTGRCLSSAELGRLGTLVSLVAGDHEIADLGWMRLATFRSLFAGLFDPPVGSRPLAEATEVRIFHRPDNRASALLLGAWLGSQLGWNEPGLEGTPQSTGPVTFTFQRSGAAPPVRLILSPDQGVCGTSGIVGLTLSAPSGLFELRRTTENHATLRLPIAPERVVKLDSHTDAELCAAALGPQGRDGLFPRVLTLAARLAATLSPSPSSVPAGARPFRSPRRGGR
jgi:hypothetical protein